MDIQFWIGFWALVWSWTPVLASIVSSKDKDKRDRELIAIRRGPSLLIEQNKTLRVFPSLYRSKVPMQENTAYMEMREWCSSNLGYQPQWLYNDRHQSYVVFRRPDDAFQFKLRWL